MPGSDVQVRRVIVHGRVQGVGYREWTRRMALRLGLTGWVRNRRDGTVEAVLEGSADQVRAMTELMRDGPMAAVVNRVEATDDAIPPGGTDTFDVRSTT
jgi:acylphosphatase